MKDSISAEDRHSLVQYRLQRSYDTLKEADYNAAGTFYNTAVNRLYYAAYYAVSALLLANSIEANTHAGVKTMLSLKFIKTGQLDPIYGRTFMTLFENRQSGDYEDFVYCDAELYALLRPKSEELINAVAALISNS